MSQSSNLKPFLPTRPSGPVFIGLNVLRAMSIVALALVFAANIVTMVDDIKIIKSVVKDGDEFTEECDYFEYSSVPDQAGGAFWSVLNRVFIAFECILLTMSEIGVPRRIFEEFIPILGPGHGLGCLGVFQALIGAQVLSHYCKRFPQVSSWLLFIIGCFNILANVSSLTPQTRMAATAWDMVSEKRSRSATPSGATGAGGGGGDNEAKPTLSRSATASSDSPLLPQNTTAPGARFGGFGFGRQGEKAAAERGWKISKPADALPRYAV
nr:uncharacterized protein CI109_003277 [Kwoniella shandongensis]KAA5528377.1 hypothetical protein CI109_003277 [Kwoniella shandongensis]